MEAGGGGGRRLGGGRQARQLRQVGERGGGRRVGAEEVRVGARN